MKSFEKIIQDSKQNNNEMLLKDIEERFNVLTTVEENEELPKLEQEILKLDVAIKNTDTRSSFEKMRLDKIVYNVNGYYKSNLERLNKEIIDCVKQFEAVGIRLTAQDFNVSEYTQEYMTVLLQEAYDGEINSERIKDTFEKEYYTGHNRRRNRQTAFYEWCSGLCGIIDTADYFCYNSAIDIVSGILKQTEEERKKYSRDAAEIFLTYLIYREIISVCK